MFGWNFVILLFMPLFSDCYLIGSGISDVTGPAEGINMMGYAKMSQQTYGIHFRLFSRAFIIADESNPASIVAFVSVDCGMISQIVKTKVVMELKKKYHFFNETNVVLSATHTHSGPGGFHQYLLFDITSLGFVKPSFDALVSGIVKSIDMAHSRLTEGKIFVASGDLLNANINRSPTSYLQNPKEERAKYAGDTDTKMTLLKFVTNKGVEIGAINWFPVHGTSMNNTNGYISGDNKGYASQKFERLKNGKQWPLNVTFVAAFAQANEGDVSPNTAGPRCLDTGLSCDTVHSTCNGNTKNCVAFGPGKDMFQSMEIIGTRQFDTALNLYKSASVELTGSVGFVHQFVDMSKEVVTLSNGTKVTTCPPAMGYSFAAGTTDGPGDFDFTQGTVQGNKFWNIVSGFIKKPSKQQIACHAPKPILLDTGEISFPYKWQADIVETQVLKIGQLLVLAVPGEFTTMSGRRLRERVLESISSTSSGEKFMAVIAGLSNTYTDYITTFEEYQAQRYEAASTCFGPHTLEAYIQQYKNLSKNLMTSSKRFRLPAGPQPPYLLDRLLSFTPPVVYDFAPIGKHFGQVIVAPKPSYRAGESVYVVMISANPRNNGPLITSFMDVEYYDKAHDQWITVYVDSHHETRFKWTRLNTLFGTSQAELTWNIPSDATPGQYRIRHRGYSKKWYIVTSKYYPFDGVTGSFSVTS